MEMNTTMTDQTTADVALTEEEYISVCRDFQQIAMGKLEERDFPMDDAERAEGQTDKLNEVVEEVVMFTEHNQFDGKCLAGYVETCQKPTTLCGSIIDCASETIIQRPFERGGSVEFHIEDEAANHLYTDVRRSLLSHFRKKFSQSEPQTA